MIDVACRHKGDKYVDWSTHQLKYKASSGLALAEADHKLRRFYIDDEDYVTQAIESKITRLGPKAARGSQVSATVPIGSTDIHVFFISEDKKSLASLTFNGTNNKWSTGMIMIYKSVKECKLMLLVLYRPSTRYQGFHQRSKVRFLCCGLVKSLNRPSILHQ